MSDESSLEDLSFWPAFTDAMLAFILVLLLVYGWLYVYARENDLRIRHAKSCQDLIAHGINSTNPEIHAEADPADPFLLRVRFSDHVLFPKAESYLNERGRGALAEVGKQIRGQLDRIVEIEIQGHADTTPMRGMTNLQLASDRANAVFEFLKQDVGIRPEEKTMSATSYGEYFPTGRRRGMEFSQQQLRAANRSEAAKTSNRRIELVLHYSRSTAPCEDKAASRGN